MFQTALGLFGGSRLPTIEEICAATRSLVMGTTANIGNYRMQHTSMRSAHELIWRPSTTILCNQQWKTSLPLGGLVILSNERNTQGVPSAEASPEVQLMSERRMQ